MNMQVFMDELMEAARQAGIETAEINCIESDSFSVTAMNGSIDAYEVSSGSGLSLRGTVNGRMGYASTQAYDGDAIRQLVQGVLESAALNEAEEQDEIFAGEERYPEVETPENDLDAFTAHDKVAMALAAEKAMLAADSRLSKSEGATVVTGRGKRTLRNSYGLLLELEHAYCAAYSGAIAKEGEDSASSYEQKAGFRLAEIDPEELGRKAAEKTVSMLHARPVDSGEYRVIIRRDAMVNLLGVFCGIFSAENAQQKMSLLGGREGEKIASDVVTIMDDPLLKGGFASTPFDAEGSASRTKAVVDHGVLTTLLHNRKTARKQGVETTGNASRGSVSSPVHVAPTNFFFQPGEKGLEELMADAGEGILITEVSGLHAGANPISGDFSLLSKGFVIEHGKQGRPVEQITVAGNFYSLLKSVRAVGSDLEFPGRGIGSPSVDVGTLSVSGK